jgi:hypothetical protein
LSVSVAHDGVDALSALWLSDLCQQEIVVQDAGALVFQQPLGGLGSASCVSFVSMASGASGFSVVSEDAGAARAAQLVLGSADASGSGGSEEGVARKLSEVICTSGGSYLHAAGPCVPYFYSW